MSNALRVALLIVLWAFLITGYATEDRSYAAAGAGIGIVLTATMVENWLAKRRRRSNRRCLQQSGTTYRSHPCTLPADGHTMHCCAFGDCSWGHF